MAGSSRASSVRAGESSRVRKHIRRLEPEEESVLINEPLPGVNVPVKSEWEEAPLRARDVPIPRTTEELIPKLMQQKLHAHRIATSAC
eukprot:3940879-Prymnesium_polylepis.1